MTIKDWIYLGITIASYLLALIAGIYTHNKSKINTTTKAGQALDVLGKLANNAVHEAEYIGGSGQEKREFASQIIVQGLSWFGIKGVTPNQVNGAIEKTVDAMNTAKKDVEPEIAVNVPEKDIVQPTKPETGEKDIVQPVLPVKDANVNGN